MLDEGEAKENLRARFPADRKPYTSGYGYDDDSDLEEDDEEDALDDEPAGPSQVATEKPSDNSDVGAIENSGSEIVSVSDLDSLFSELSDMKGGSETASTAHIGKVVVIEDVAFVTWVCFG